MSLNYKLDEQLGSIAEDDFISLWKDHPDTISIKKGDQYNPYIRKHYDIELITSREKTRYEVKFDIGSGKTGNAFFELFNTRGWRTGLMCTRADYFVMRFNENGAFFIAKPHLIIQFLMMWGTKEWKPVCGDGNSTGIIVPKADYIGQAFVNCMPWRGSWD